VLQIQQYHGTACHHASWAGWPLGYITHELIKGAMQVGVSAMGHTCTQSGVQHLNNDWVRAHLSLTVTDVQCQGHTVRE